MKLLGFLSEDAVVLDMKARTKEEAIRELARVVIASGEADAANEEKIVKAVLDREARGSTGLGDGIAIPHVKDCPDITGLTGAFGRSSRGIAFDAVDGHPVHLIFLILGGAGTASEHVGILRKLAALRMNEHFLRFLRDEQTSAGVVETIREMAGSVA